MSVDPTRIELKTNVKKEKDPTLVRMSGTAVHGNTPFDVPFISQIDGNLWQGGCQTGLILPHFFKSIISLYPWEAYRVTHELENAAYFKMFDSIDQDTDIVSSIAQLVYSLKQRGPVLIHCQAGLNRSGLVAGKVLMMEGYSADEAIKVLREKRSPAVLCNPAFEENLRSSES